MNDVCNQPAHDRWHQDREGSHGMYAALANAIREQVTVVLALADGTRLNGVPVGLSRLRCLDRGGPGEPAGFASGVLAGRPGCPFGSRCPAATARDAPALDATVLLREEAGHEPFVVRLSYVVYLRVLTPSAPDIFDPR